jgi:hypothetical protein
MKLEASPLVLILVVVVATACSSPADGTADKAARCASTFGQALTNSFGRVDGKVLAVVQPTDTQCALANDDHLVLEVLMNGEVYRMVVNLDVGLASRPAALPAPAFAEGWHEAQTLDYPSLLGLHSTDFERAPDLATMSRRIADLIDVDDDVSVYASSSGGETASSAHLVHRNGGQHDGAIVVGARSASPTFLAFAFSNQAF